MGSKPEIKALVMDVDGTLTDGGLYIGADGEVMKRFHVRDGYAIHDLLPQMGILLQMRILISCKLLIWGMI